MVLSLVARTATRPTSNGTGRKSMNMIAQTSELAASKPRELSLDDPGGIAGGFGRVGIPP